MSPIVDLLTSGRGYLPLNAYKTELLTDDRKSIVKVQNFELAIGDVIIRPFISAEHRSAVFDDRLSFKEFYLKFASAAVFFTCDPLLRFGVTFRVISLVAYVHNWS